MIVVISAVTILIDVLFSFWCFFSLIRPLLLFYGPCFNIYRHCSNIFAGAHYCNFVPVDCLVTAF